VESRSLQGTHVAQQIAVGTLLDEIGQWDVASRQHSVYIHSLVTDGALRCT